MKIFSDDAFLNESLDKIVRLATPTLYGMTAINVQFAVDRVIDDVFRYLLAAKSEDPEAFLLAFKNGLATLADDADNGMNDYKNTLYDAIRSFS